MNKLTLVALGSVPLLGMVGCEKITSWFSSEKEAAAPAEMPALPVSVLVARPTEHVVKADLPGRLEPFRQAEVRARVSGILTKRVYEEGQDVKEGDLLFQIDAAPYEALRDSCVASVERAVANLQNLEDKEARYKPLAEKGSISQRDYTETVSQKKMAKAELALAKAELKKADLELGYTKVVSPISGRARGELVTEGALVGHGTPTPLTVVEQLDPIYVKFSQPMKDIMALQNGVTQAGWKELNLDKIPIHITLPNGSTYKHAGKLVFSDISVDPETDNVQMKAVLPNPGYSLLPGTYVRVQFDRAVRQSVFMVPVVAVTKTAQGSFVMIVNKDNIVEMRPVTTADIDGDQWVVTSGLNEGDKIITGKSMMGVRPGSKVVISEESAPKGDKAEQSNQ